VSAARSGSKLSNQSIGKCSASLFERATMAAYFALSICVSRWLVSLTSVPHQTFMRVTEGASSGSFPYSAARLHCSLRLRRTQQRRCYSADWRALDSESVRFHLRWVNLIRGPFGSAKANDRIRPRLRQPNPFHRPLCSKEQVELIPSVYVNDKGTQANCCRETRERTTLLVNRQL
jgi:hypothetical protein